jgi:hypothetical protein
MRKSFPFTGHQTPLPPVGHRTMPSRDQVVSFYRTHERVSWDMCEFLDMPWEAIQIDKLTATDVQVLETTMLVESNNPDYVANLLRFFQADIEACDFLMMWGVEEWKHYYVLRDFLCKVRIAAAAKRNDTGVSAEDKARLHAIEEAANRALDNEVDNVRRVSKDNWIVPDHYRPVQLVACTTIQEFLTAEFYKNHSDQLQEPTLSRIELLLAKDEKRHEMFYEGRLKALLEADKDATTLVVAALKEFGMPGAYLLDDYDEKRTVMEDAAYPSPADKKVAFKRVFNKMAKIIGQDKTMEVFTQGYYLSDGVEDPARKKMKPQMVERLIMRQLN